MGPTWARVRRVVAIVALAVTVFGCSSDEAAPTVRDVDATGRDLVVEFLTILQQADNAALDRFLSPAFQIVRADGNVKGKVGVVTGVGSGHKPAFIGYSGRGTLDAVAVGEIFTSRISADGTAV